MSTLEKEKLFKALSIDPEALQNKSENDFENYSNEIEGPTAAQQFLHYS